MQLRGPNDIVFDGDGGFWFTDHGKTYGRVMDTGAVYHAAADGYHTCKLINDMQALADAAEDWLAETT